jgi:hypothetical protein
LSRPKPNSAPPLRASHRWILDSYKAFCQFIYGPGATIYDLISSLVSLGQWHTWRKLSLDLLPQGRILELGFGTGWLQMELAKSGRLTYGLEYSSDMVKKCHQLSLRQKFTSHRVQGDGQHLPFAQASFNGIVATFPEQYIASLDCLRECRRVITLNPSSQMIVVGRWLELDLPILKQIFPVFYRPLNLLEVEDFRQMAEESGWKMELRPLKCGHVLHYIILLSPREL